MKYIKHINEELGESGWEKIKYTDYDLEEALRISGITTGEDKISPKVLTQIYGLFSDTSNMEYDIRVYSTYKSPYSTPNFFNRTNPSSNSLSIGLYKGFINILPYDDEWFLVGIGKRDWARLNNEIWTDFSWFKCDQLDQLMDLMKQAIHYHNK